MSHHSKNPFLRGYSGLSIQRQIAIHYEDDCPMAYRPLHPSQSHLPDDQIARFPCIFNDDFVMITEGQVVSDELDDKCRGDGVARNVIYAIMADDSGTPIHVGDTYSEEAAREIVRRLTFETGHYSRCWEISSGHLPATARQYLEDLADTSTVTGMFFEAFRIRDSHAVGIKLIATPWTDENLKDFTGEDAEALYNEQVEARVPQPLIAVMKLASLADVRILIFDPDAATLEGLSEYDD